MSFEDSSQHLHDGFQTAKTYIQNTPGWLYEGFQNAKALTTVTVGSIILAKVLDPDLGVVTAGSSLVKQAEFAFPSIIPDAPITGEPYDLGIDVAFTAATLAVAGQELNNGHTTKKGLLGTATLAQVLASGWDAIADRTWLNPAEKKLPDDGDSSVLGGILTKAALDHFWAARQNEEFGTGKKLLVGAGLGTVALMSTVGALAAEGSQGGKLDMISHAAGITAGAIAHFVGRFLKRRKAEA
ncbi:MAG TPA: hypothetical protein VFC50_00395 [Candidatus Dormibacteraeota bacterium]|nr:hypothetical protein [Candidatus Dormibacteraeota bacterium]